MKRLLRLMLGLIALSLVGVVAVGLYSRLSVKPGPVVPQPATGEKDLLVIPDFRHSQYEGDRLAWELRAEKATFSDMTHASLLRPIMEIHSRKQGRVTIDFEEGSIDLARKNLDARGETTVTTEDGYTMRTRDVAYDGTLDRLTTVSGFTVEGTGLKAEGKKLTVYPGERRFEASEAIRVIYFPAVARGGGAG
jgi:hypothetical protein